MAGGLIPVVLGIVLFKVLPESPRFLARRPERWPELTAMLGRMGHAMPADVAYIEADAGGAPMSRASLGDIFAPAYVRDTLALFASFFFCLLVNYIAILLIPVTFTDSGFAQGDANYMQYVFNLGGVIGAIGGALIIQRLGSRAAMLGMTAVAIAASLMLARMPLVSPASFALMALMILSGALLNGVQTTMYALAAHVYPTEIRGTGVGAAVAFGRIGNTMAAYVGNYAARTGGNAGYFSSWAVCMGLVFISLALIRRHIPRTGAMAEQAAPALQRTP
jgi:AAHS family 4-hydroxybenzoate transporter-like MFS transporter